MSYQGTKTHRLKHHSTSKKHFAYLLWLIIHWPEACSDLIFNLTNKFNPKMYRYITIGGYLFYLLLLLFISYLSPLIRHIFLLILILFLLSLPIQLLQFTNETPSDNDL